MVKESRIKRIKEGLKHRLDASPELLTREQDIINFLADNRTIFMPLVDIDEINGLYTKSNSKKAPDTYQSTATMGLVGSGIFYASSGLLSQELFISAPIVVATVIPFAGVMAASSTLKKNRKIRENALIVNANWFSNWVRITYEVDIKVDPEELHSVLSSGKLSEIPGSYGNYIKPLGDQKFSFEGTMVARHTRLKNESLYKNGSFGKKLRELGTLVNKLSLVDLTHIESNMLKQVEEDRDKIVVLVEKMALLEHEVYEDERTLASLDELIAELTMIVDARRDDFEAKMDELRRFNMKEDKE